MSASSSSSQPSDSAAACSTAQDESIKKSEQPPPLPPTTTSADVAADAEMIPLVGASSSDEKSVDNAFSSDSGTSPSKLPGNIDLEALKIPTTLTGIFSIAGLWQIVIKRTGLLVSLLLLQSLSQFILESYEHLITFHVVVPLFLTMLVGAGGNAGNQAAVRVIAGLVTKEYTVADTWRVLRSEVAIGFVNGILLAGIGFTRVYWMYEDGTGLFWSAFAITLSLFCIVLSSSVLGTLLPFFLEYIGVDREHAAPAIQVVMDITGVLITCLVCTALIPASEHQTAHHHHGPGPKTTTALPVAPKP